MIRTGESYARATLDDTWDVIVIGSGIGGLTTAAILAKHAGKRVLVLERHYVAGGFTHSFARPGYDWDVGVHYIGDVQDPEHPTRRLFDELTGGTVAWADMGEVYDRIVIGDDVYDYVSGLRNWRERMVGYFPDEAVAIDGYIDAVKAVSGAFRPYLIEKTLPDLAARVAGGPLRSRFLSLANRTTGEVIGGLTNNTRLAAVLTGQWGDYGLPPGRSSFAMHAIVTNHYFRGGSYPVGGASVIAAGAERVIASGGGRIIVRAEVDEVVLDGGKAVGVRMADGRVFRAPEIVSNAGVYTTYQTLLPAEASAAIGADEVLRKVDRSVGHLSLYLGLDASTADLGLQKPNLWLYESDDFDGDWARFEADPSAPIPLTYLSFPSAKDPDFEVRHPGHSTIDVIVPALHEWFAPWADTSWNKRGDDYTALKDSFRERLLAKVAEHVPLAMDHVDVAELSSPLSTSHFANYSRGELYGLDHTADRFAQKWLRPRTPVDHLWLTGQDVITCGVASAMFGGLLTASAMAGRDLLTHTLTSKVRDLLPG